MAILFPLESKMLYLFFATQLSDFHENQQLPTMNDAEDGVDNLVRSFPI